MDFRRAGIAVVVSRLIRSLFTPTDVQTSLRLELSEFRTEVQRAESTLKQTTLILEHCNGYSKFLEYLLKVVAISEIVLLCWLLYLLTLRQTTVFRHSTPALTDSSLTVDSPTSSDEVEVTSAGVAPTQSPPRAGPVRPSDLKNK